MTVPAGYFRGMVRQAADHAKGRSLPAFPLTLSGRLCYVVRAGRLQRQHLSPGGERNMATKTNFFLKVQDAKLADVQKALKDANINVVSIMEVHKEEA